MNPLPLAAVIGGAAGIPPGMSNATSWSMLDAFVLVIVYLLAAVVATALMVWVDRKLSARELFRDIYRELGIGRPPTR